jgi:hypothetical protein
MTPGSAPPVAQAGCHASEQLPCPSGTFGGRAFTINGRTSPTIDSRSAFAVGLADCADARLRKIRPAGGERPAYRSGADRREVSELSCRIMLPRRCVTEPAVAAQE